MKPPQPFKLFANTTLAPISCRVINLCFIEPVLISTLSSNVNVNEHNKLTVCPKEVKQSTKTLEVNPWKRKESLEINPRLKRFVKKVQKKALKMQKHSQSLSRGGLPKAKSVQKPAERTRSGSLYNPPINSTNQRMQRKIGGVT